MGEDPEKDVSVYDFLYVDARRIGILISQLGDGTDGVLKAIQRKSTKGGKNHGGIDLKLVKIGSEEDAHQEMTSSYDAQWLLPLRFLDLAQSRINTDISKATLGQLVLARGPLRFQNHTLVMSFLSNHSIRGKLASSTNIDPMQTIELLGTTKEEYGKKKPAEQLKLRRQAIDLLMDVVTSLPVRSQVEITGDHGSSWSVLNEDGLVIAYNELTMTHGPSIPGEWIVVGLLDARADSDPDATTVADEIVPVQTAQTFSQMNGFAVSLRKIVGRPLGSHSITPLVIFREVLT
jgi:hypothetical protein